ncbi:MAG: sulfurtransferase [Rhodanobacteraceae bacterium]|nr:MAG: sulfurtransferase [Rhodanobacteraceae bacterium]
MDVVQSSQNILIAAEALAALPRDLVLVVDCRFTLTDPDAGERDFLAGHIPGAVYANLDRDLSDLSKKGLGRHPLPNPDAFAQTLSSWGWQRRQRIVAYDAQGGAMAAARLWWMLRRAGVEAGVLDGGWQAWCKAGLPIESGSAAAGAPSAVTLQFDGAQAVDYTELDSLRMQPSALVLDARGAPRFRGDFEPIDRVAGHVPGARNRPFSLNLDAGKHFKPASELRAEFAALLDGRAPEKVVHMCGSGVFACHNQLAMEIAGLSGSRVFVPSWSGWSSDPARPIATGEA